MKDYSSTIPDFGAENTWQNKTKFDNMFRVKLAIAFIDVIVASILLGLIFEASGIIRLSNSKISYFPPALDSAMVVRPVGGYLGVTPSWLNRHQNNPLQEHQAILYVGRGQASTNPFTVSVNVIDPNTIAAVAMGLNGRCYAELSEVYGANGENGRTLYAEFADGTPCYGVKATVLNVLDTNQPL